MESHGMGVSWSSFTGDCLGELILSPAEVLMESHGKGVPWSSFTGVGFS